MEERDFLSSVGKKRMTINHANYKAHAHAHTHMYIYIYIIFLQQAPPGIREFHSFSLQGHQKVTSPRASPAAKAFHRNVSAQNPPDCATVGGALRLLLQSDDGLPHHRSLPGAFASPGWHERMLGRDEHGGSGLEHESRGAPARWDQSFRKMLHWKSCLLACACRVLDFYK